METYRRRGEMRDFGTDVKKAGGDEGSRCMHSYMLDTYGCGCQHDCSYCYAKSLLSFRGLWNADSPSVATPQDVNRAIRHVPVGEVVRLGGMTDCLMPQEKTYRATYNAIKKLNRREIPYLIVTKSALVADREYMNAYDRSLAHFQISITATDNAVSARYEKASSVEERIRAYETLSEAGFDVSLRISPLIPGNIDYTRLDGHKCLVEFLRVNHWIERWLPLDYSAWTVREGGYRHLPLDLKKHHVEQIASRFDQISVCEDVQGHYEYWRDNVNHNRDDCCNLGGYRE